MFSLFFTDAQMYLIAAILGAVYIVIDIKRRMNR